MTQQLQMRAKVCLVGEPAVGKTSLIRRFVHDDFDDSYVATLQAKFSKKETSIALPERDLRVNVDMVVWDIMGDKGHRRLLKEAYFYGAQGILAACDVTRRSTLDDLQDWWRSVQATVGRIPWVVVVNKLDLSGHYTFGEQRVQRVTAGWDAPSLFTSAKTGDQVVEAFALLASRMFEAHGTRVLGALERAA